MIISTLLNSVRNTGLDIEYTQIIYKFEWISKSNKMTSRSATEYAWGSRKTTYRQKHSSVLYTHTNYLQAFSNLGYMNI
jgi:hypothetical protein